MEVMAAALGQRVSKVGWLDLDARIDQMASQSFVIGFERQFIVCRDHKHIRPGQNSVVGGFFVVVVIKQVSSALVGERRLMRLWHLSQIRFCILEDDMGVGAAIAEGVDTGDTFLWVWPSSARA